MSERVLDEENTLLCGVGKWVKFRLPIPISGQDWQWGLLGRT